MATGTVKKLIKSKPISGTTTATGALATGLDTTKTVVIAARANASSVCVIRNDAYITVLQASDLHQMANTAVDATIWYIDI